MPRVIFGIMSATQQGATVTQLARALQPHLVVVHHDFRKRADFAVHGSNVRLVPDPCDTGWGAWGFSAGIFHTIDYCLKNFDFDYFHLMSPTCMPIRPLREFEEWISRDEYDVHADLFAVESDEQTLMTFGYRTFAPGSSLRFRLLRWARQVYFGTDASLRQTSSLSVLNVDETGRTGARGREMDLSAGLTRWAARGMLGPNPFGKSFVPMVGSSWIGMKRPVCEYIVAMRDDPRIARYFKKLQIVDETMFPTLLGNSPFRIGPACHAINDFTDAGNPRWIDDKDLTRILGSTRYFARKFPDDPTNPVRLRLLRERLGLNPVESAAPVRAA